jgi:Glycosyl hydrolase catalytic core
MATAVIAAAVFPAHPPAVNAPPQFFGVNYTAMTLAQKDVQRMARGGIRNVRWTFSWPQIRRPNGRLDWSATDRTVGDLAAKGIRVLPVLYGSSPFLSPLINAPPLNSPAARQEWELFLAAAVARYGPGGAYWTEPRLYPSQHPDRPPVPVRAWQVWNEPNLKSHFLPHPSPRRYARLLEISHRAITEVDPQATVLFAGMPGFSKDIDGWRFLDRVYGAPGAGETFDAVALHPYATNLHQVRAEVERVRRVMARHGDRLTPLWITELSWGSDPPSRFGLTKGLEGQKRMLRRSFALFSRERRHWRIPHVFWYELRDPRVGGGCSFCASAGLFSHDFQPKPAWRVFRRFTGGSR